MDIDSLRDDVRKAALINAAQFEGKANPKAVLGKILGEHADARKNVPEVMKLINSIVSEVNSMPFDAQRKELESQGVGDNELSRKGENVRKELKELANVKGNVVMRFAPNPNGPLSLGHSRQALLNWFYVQKYGGKYVLRLDDTDPKVKTPIKEAYSWIVEDASWLGIKPDTVIRASERFDIYYEHAENLIKDGKAYVCTCAAGEFAELKKSKTACPCRSLSKEENLERWNSMFDSYKEGDAVLRIKTDIKHKNPAIRDWPAFRIVDNPKHPYLDCKVWPLYDFASAIDDHLTGVTHIIRGIDFLATGDKQGYLYDYFGWEYPENIVTGKLIIEGIKSTSESRKMIEQGLLSGWDDPRLGTLMSLRKRGFSRDAIREFIWDVGVKRSDVKVSLDTLEAKNRQMIDSSTERYFAAIEPVEIDISCAKKSGTDIEVHSPTELQAPRRLNPGKIVLVSKTDFDKYRGKNVRLKELACGILDTKFKVSDDEDSIKAEDSRIQILQWVPAKENALLEIIMPDATRICGRAEKHIMGAIGKVVQLERVGFVKLSEESGRIMAYFAHR